MKSVGTPVGITVTRTRVSAACELSFLNGEQPVVRAREGILTGCRFRLAELHVTVTALTQDDGSVHVHTALRPTAGSLVYDPAGDETQLTHSDHRLLTLKPEHCPEAVQPVVDELVRAVYTFHPGLKLADAPTA